MVHQGREPSKVYSHRRTGGYPDSSSSGASRRRNHQRISNSITNMQIDEIELRLKHVIEKCRTLDPVLDDILTESLSFNESGEPGIALEELCRQIYEYDVVVPLSIYEEIVMLGVAMGLKSAEWEILAKGPG